MMELSHTVPDGWGLLPQTIPIYAIFMVLAFAAAFLVYLVNARGDESRSGHLLPIVLGAFFGGLIGAKLPVVLMNLRFGFDWQALLAGRTIAGGLIGGMLGVLFIKKKLGIRGRHGNALAAPIALGMAVGRIGCLLSGCCFGKPTSLAWGVDFGDAIARHPTQVYEIVFWLGAFVILQLARRNAPPGQLLTSLFVAYFVFRFFEEFIRPNPGLIGLTVFQWICLAGILILYAKARLMTAAEEAP